MEASPAGIPAMIEARSLTKSYADLVRGPVLALDDVSFSAKAGQIYGLLGPNGAGKTTALRILSTVLQPTNRPLVSFHLTDGADVELVATGSGV